MTVRTRFAPSPTGFMHIGGMRTALFNWLWARHHGGQFILRIDDTDQARHVEEALQPILDSFRWLGLDWDEGPESGGPHGPYFQSERGDLYRAAIEELLQRKLAYRDFHPQELARQEREAAEKEKRNYLNNRSSLELSDAEIQAKVDADETHVIRLLMPRGENRTVTFEDLVRGEVSFNVSEVSDPVLFRSNGQPLYNFACVVDDALMGITHVIRAEEHLSNTPTQIMIYEAIGKAAPTFAHVPFITAPGSKKKLSKRDFGKLENNPQMRHLFADGREVLGKLGREMDADLNPVTVAFYEALGYLPAGVINGLARLGWAYDDKTEEMSREFIVEHFGFESAVKAPAGFDPEKLMSYQSHWMNELPIDERVAECLRFLKAGGMIDDETDPQTVEQVRNLVETLGERIRIFGDILSYNEYFVGDDEMEYDPKAFAKRIENADGARDHLATFRERLADVEPFDAASTETLLKDYCEEREIKLGEIIHALRVAVTGKPKGPGMFEALELLGRDRVLNRIDRVLATES